ncbi:MAG TPA: energy transducer TonB [Vicinamibacteria bacterium]|nr:energy transducer TonB [Vicinamibacteria bacterium]
MQPKSAAHAGPMSVLTGEPIEVRTRQRGHSAIATGVAAGTHVLILLALMVFLGRVPTLSEGPVGFEPLTLVFEIEVGPGGGGGGGGEESPAPPSVRKAEGEDVAEVAIQPKATEPLIFEPDPTPVEQALEPAMDVVAPFVPTAPDEITQKGVLEGTEQANESGGPGSGGGAGTGVGTGIGPGEGPGVGEGRGGGYGGGAYRVGSGVEPPIVIRRVEPAYTNEALRKRIEGEVVLEVIILKDGTVGSVGLIESLDPELDRSAIEAVRKWRFLPGKFRGQPVDVIAEVVVDFKLF